MNIVGSKIYLKVKLKDPTPLIFIFIFLIELTENLLTRFYLDS